MPMPLRLALSLAAATLLALPAAANAGHTSDPRTPNLVPLGHIEEPAVLGGFGGAEPDIHTDIAFRGRYAIQGNWDGFNIRDISNPAAPTTVSRTFCEGNQGDVLVYRNVVVRSWNTPAGTPGAFGAALTCDGQDVEEGFEGLHVFDISNLGNPELVAQVPTPCGSHTATAVPDPANNRLLVYDNPSSGSEGCAGFAVVSIPLDAPQNAAMLRHEDLATPEGAPGTYQCHDMSVFLAVRLAACAGGPGFSVWSLGGARGGSLEDPELLYQVPVPTVSVGHSTAFSWDGKIIVFGHEPGGGIAAECEATDHPLKRSLFFYRASDGVLLGTWTLPRPQLGTENCTIHNFNVVPYLDRHVLVHGSYQSGTSVVDFTSPSAAREIAWSDPPPRVPAEGSPFCSDTGGCDVGGAWSSYWYNDRIYETNINEGLNIFRLAEPWANRALELPYLNPQTQERIMSCTVQAQGAALRARRASEVHVIARVRGWNQGAPAVRVRLLGPGIGRTLRTNGAGEAMVTLRPTRAGTLRITVRATLNMQGCSTSRRVARAATAGAGTGGAGTGGAGLTGRSR
ncbi:MAG: hypothetical protein ICV74_07530 [Thermoleophilia bacterium]|nr:hypothetical protein [Thermoleophilia bacterium]